MSKILIIYRSQYGATKSYATYLADRVGAVVKSYKDVKKKDIIDANTIIFGGGVYISKLAILKTVKRFQPLLESKKLYLFAVGLTDTSFEAMPRIEAANSDIFGYHFKEVFYFPGTFEVDKMNWFHRSMLHMINKMMAKKTNLTEDEKALYDAINHPQDKRDMQLLHPLIEQLELDIYG